MKTAIFSDVHGNLEALKIVLNDIEKRHVERVVCLGDIVEGGNNDIESVEMVQQINGFTVQGNHDVNNDCELPFAIQNWLNNLPILVVEDDVIFTHITPRKKRPVKIANALQAWNVFDEEDFKICFIGHTHFPVLFSEKSDSFAEAKIEPIIHGVFSLDASERYIISFGAVGYPRRSGEYIRYGIFDDVTMQVEFVQLDGPLLAL